MLSTYRRVLATPGLRSLLVAGLLAKVPGLGIPAVLLLHDAAGTVAGFAAVGVVSAVVGIVVFWWDRRSAHADHQ